METEQKLVQYTIDAAYDDLPRTSVDIIKNVLLTVLGTTIAGARDDGCEDFVKQAGEWGGKEEATILIYGGKVPAHNAAFVNSIMARALDFCDGMVPGIHVGSSSVPTALAACELAGGCSGKEFLTALVVGTEIASRLNSVSVYDGFDPTGVCTVFAATAIAGRLLHLDPHEMLNALALGFNRGGGSMQSNIDGSLAVRVIQGSASQSGIISAQLAKRGITGPGNFLEGTYGYFHFYAKDKTALHRVTDELGKRFELDKTLFKRYPSCGGTLAPTDAVLDLIRETDIVPEEIKSIDILVSPHVYKLVGGPFKVGKNPRVDAQFNIRYCVANALLRKSSRLRHFDESCVRDPGIMDLVNLIHVSPEASYENPGKAAFSIGCQVNVAMKDGSVYSSSSGVPRGGAGSPLTAEEHAERFRDCINYSEGLLPQEQVEEIASLVGRLEQVDDVTRLIPLLIPEQVHGAMGSRG
jgi:2-methylcitrate dehydratase PrpD